jgi:hypothetical protein
VWYGFTKGLEKLSLMKLPNLGNAIISETKIVDYLLSPIHPAGKSKAKFFVEFGFDRENWHQLADALRRHASDYPVAQVEESEFGQRFVIDGPLDAPDGRRPMVRAIWFIESSSDAPHLVTAHPLKRG